MAGRTGTLSRATSTDRVLYGKETCDTRQRVEALVRDARAPPAGVDVRVGWHARGRHTFEARILSMIPVIPSIVGVE